VTGGSQFAMRFWLKPDRIAQLGVTANDIITSINDQNVQAPVGGFGLPPGPKSRNSNTPRLPRGG